MRRPKPVLVAVSSDQHCNSMIGLCPAEGVALDEGGKYLPSKAQQWTWDCWLNYHRAVRDLRKELGARLVYVNNGDAVDGDHHNTSQIITRNMESQAYITHRVFSVVKDLAPDEVYVVRGTTTHVGEGAAAEEALAKHLKAQRDPDTESWSSWHVRLDIHGRELDFQHHASVGGLPWTVPGGVARLAFKHWAERLQAGLRPADVIVRSHKHVHADSYGAHRTRAIITPAWQLKTAFAHKVATESIADIGSIAVIVWPDKEPEVRKWLYQPALPTLRNVA